MNHIIYVRTISETIIIGGNILTGEIHSNGIRQRFIVILTPDKVYFDLNVPYSHKGVSGGANNLGYLRGFEYLHTL